MILNSKNYILFCIITFLLFIDKIHKFVIKDKSEYPIKRIILLYLKALIRSFIPIYNLFLFFALVFNDIKIKNEEENNDREWSKKIRKTKEWNW